MGFPAIRFTEFHENFARQHQNIRKENGIQYGDLPEFVDFAYTANVARINLIAVASLAKAPAALGSDNSDAPPPKQRSWHAA